MNFTNYMSQPYVKFYILFSISGCVHCVSFVQVDLLVIIDTTGSASIHPPAGTEKDATSLRRICAQVLRPGSGSTPGTLERCQQ